MNPVTLLCPDDLRGEIADLVPTQTPRRVLISYLWKHKVTKEVLAQHDMSFNFHPAPLPQYRGFAPYTFGILNGERVWGVTCHYMNEEIDSGPIVEVRNFIIDDPEQVTAKALRAATTPHLKGLLIDVMQKVCRDEILKSTPNVGGKYYNRRDFEKARTALVGAADLDRYRRAFYCPPYPGFGEP